MRFLIASISSHIWDAIYTLVLESPGTFPICLGTYHVYGIRSFSTQNHKVVHAIFIDAYSKWEISKQIFVGSLVMGEIQMRLQGIHLHSRFVIMLKSLQVGSSSSFIMVINLKENIKSMQILV